MADTGNDAAAYKVKTVKFMGRRVGIMLQVGCLRVHFPAWQLHRFNGLLLTAGARSTGLLLASAVAAAGEPAPHLLFPSERVL